MEGIWKLYGSYMEVITCDSYGTGESTQKQRWASTLLGLQAHLALSNLTMASLTAGNSPCSNPVIISHSPLTWS